MIFVDPLFYWVSKVPAAKIVGARHGHLWCHMWCDGDLRELHAMAARLGQKRAWFQNHSRVAHYDLVPPVRVAALKFGAVEWSMAAFLRGDKPPAPGASAQGELSL